MHNNNKNAYCQFRQIFPYLELVLYEQNNRNSLKTKFAKNIKLTRKC